MSFRLNTYRALARSSLVKGWAARKLGASRLQESERWRTAVLTQPGIKRHNSTIWFHASSAGELESLWQIIAELGDKSFLIVTIFSASSEKALNRLKAEMAAKETPLFFSGYCPWESDWQDALRQFKPNLFVTTKYEAWPELWAGLALEKIPLMIVGASDRSSLRWGKKICEFLISQLPKLYLSTSLENGVPALTKLFPTAQIKNAGEPRWDRVASRKKAGGSPRSKEVLAKVQTIWGELRPPVLAQIWMQDLEIWKTTLAAMDHPMIVVPHQVDAAHVFTICDYLKKVGFRVYRSSQDPWDSLHATGRNILVVDELGVLLDLYQCVRWAYVGGGFGDGVHSTLEPGLYGIPISCGPNGAEKFSEIQLLASIGQLTLFQDSARVGEWVQRVEKESPASEAWMERVHGQLGATIHHIAWIDEILRSSC